MPPSVFDTAFAAVAVGPLNTQFGQSVTFLPAAGGSSAITADVNSVHVEVKDGSSGLDEVQARRVTTVLTDTPTPHRDDAFTIDGETWKSMELPHVSGADVAYLCVRVTPVERTARGYRR